MKRLYFIDWLRILAIMTVFFFHASHFFDPIYWHVKNPQQNSHVLFFLGFVNIWIMPLFFFLSGASGIFGIQKPFKIYFAGKVKRLLIPLLMGALLLIPPQKYVEALSHQTFAGGYLEFLKVYFGGKMFEYDLGFSSAWIGILSYHLWYLGHLFIISIVLLPVLRYIASREEAISNAILRLTSFPGGALLMFIPVAIVRVLLKKHFTEYTGWADLAMFSVYFLWGFIYIRNEALKNTLVRSRYLALLTGSVLCGLYFLSFRMKDTTFGQLFQDNKVMFNYIFQETSGALATWSWIIFIIATGMKYLNRDTKYREPLNEAVMPVYILHQTVLLLIGYFVVQWSWGSWYKFGFICLSSLFTILIIYVFAVKPFKSVRYLFGMGRKS